MKFLEAVIEVKKSIYDAVSIDEDNKIIFYMDYAPKPYRFSDVIVFASGDYFGEENYSPEEFMSEFINAKEMDFTLVKKDASIYGLEYEYALIEIKKNIIN